MKIDEKVLDIIAIDINQRYEENETNPPDNINEYINIATRLEGRLDIIDFLKGILRDDKDMIEYLNSIMRWILWQKMKTSKC